MTQPDPAPAALRLRALGAVQGVGFRPFVYREATALGLAGWVQNTPQGVDILAAGPPDRLAAFTARLHSPPPPAAVTALDTEPAAPPFPTGPFTIRPSATDGERAATLLPDLATCPDCLRELRDPANRRHRYPFINCTACGPRTTIIESLPYDRARTTMRAFPLCPACRCEFEDPADRRFHAQPNACPACGPRLTLLDAAGRACATGPDALARAAALLRDGRIVAVKGLGGFHLMADAARDDAVHALRTRKHRAEKPFAVMMPDLATAARYTELDAPARAALTSPAAPIVLARKTSAADTLSPALAPGNPCLGVLLPYTPLHHLLLDDLARPLVATSGNLSDEPLCTDNDEAVQRLGGIADAFLVHDRAIAHPIDDSVVRIVLGRPLLLRAARGLAPIALTLPAPGLDRPTLGLGAHMKTTVALGHRRRLIVGPHIGDLENDAAWTAHQRSAALLEQLHDVHAEHLVCDLHPDYPTTRHARARDPAALAVQHHHAHVLAVMAEHEATGPVLGLVADGTGYGTDGTIWGGEVLRVDGPTFQRLGHLLPFPLPGGDTAAREPRRSALGLLHTLGRTAEAPDFTDAERTLLIQAIDRRINTVMTSSLGRLFDAVAALLGLCTRATYEGQAAMQVQALAESITPDPPPFGGAPTLDARGIWDWRPVITDLLAARAAGLAPALCAARFHAAIVAWWCAAADAHPGLPIALAGGCFQNAWLLERTVTALRARRRTVLWPQRLPPNDAAIAAGQVLAATLTPCLESRYHVDFPRTGKPAARIFQSLENLPAGSDRPLGSREIKP